HLQESSLAPWRSASTFRAHLLQQHVAVQLHAGNVESALPHVSLQVVGDAAVTVEVADPLPVLPVRKSPHCPFQYLLEPRLVFLLSREGVGQERGIDGFVMGPEQLHVPLVLYGLLSFDVHEVKDTSVFSV